MKKIFLIFCLFLPFLYTACPSMPTQTGSQSERIFQLARDAVFEVVVEKPAEGSVVYEGELDWSLVPFAIRNDEYFSIGTAFAISNTELVTAFHVINLAYKSMVFEKYFIRDSDGNVFEIDQITGGNNEKDYLIFTVKGRTFNQYFQLERDFNAGDTVYSIGNALGEGIVIRNGLVLGTVPEADSGRWEHLKSSADGNPGNSGGPLVTSSGKVIAVVTALRENILYSTPIDTILDDDRSVLQYRDRFVFGHLILSNRFNNIFETQVSLPGNYINVQQKLIEAFRENYDFAMTSLFNEAPEYLTGNNSYFLLNSTLTSIFPEISFVDPNDSHWKLSNLNRRTYNLSDNGRLSHASVSSTNFYKIIRPDSISVETVNTNPTFIMDLILHTIRTDRTLWGGNRYRMLSYGEPTSTGTFKDSLGRTWITAHWLISFADQVQIMYILPLPNGPAVITTLQGSSYLLDYIWDMQRLCEHVFAAYDGKFTDWVDYLSLEKYIPDFFNNLNFDWDSSEQKFTFDTGSLSIFADNRVFDWNDRSEIFIAPTWYKLQDDIEFGIRRIMSYSDHRGREFFVIAKNIRPDQRLGATFTEQWNDLVIERFPFNGRPSISARENTGSKGAIIRAETPNPDVLYSLYLSMESPESEEDISLRFNALKEGIDIDF